MQLTAVQLLVCGALRLVKVSRPDVKDRPIDVHVEALEKSEQMSHQKRSSFCAVG